MLHDLEPGHPVWILWAGERLRARVVETVHPRSGARLVVVRSAEDAGPYRRGKLAVVAPRALRWRAAGHRKEGP